MNTRTDVLKTLVRDGHYVIDEAAVANAILVRALARGTVPDVTFRCPAAFAEPEVRSFRVHNGARSFRLSRGERRTLHTHDGELLADHA